MFYQVLKDFLLRGTYTQEDAAGRIDYGVAGGKLTSEEAAELQGIASANAKPNPLLEKIEELTRRVEVLEGAPQSEPTEFGPNWN